MNKNAQGGFTLIEIMVVVVILGLLAALLVPKIMDRPDEAKVVKTKLDIKSLEAALKLYRLDNGRYPTTEQGLKALVAKSDTQPIPRNFRSGGYLESSEVPLDPWSKPYIYRCPGDAGRDYEILSYGSDEQEGGSGFAADIKSYELTGKDEKKGG